jgi:hypothetical protein
VHAHEERHEALSSVKSIDHRSFGLLGAGGTVRWPKPSVVFVGRRDVTSEPKAPETSMTKPGFGPLE